jgi:hypothetical protein
MTKAKLFGRMLAGVCVVLAVCGISHGATWHVAPNGLDTNDGSEHAPMLTLAKAVEDAAKVGEETEIVLHAGVYAGDVIIPDPLSPGVSDAKAQAAAPKWTIRAATKPGGGVEQVVIDGGQKPRDVVVVDAKRGIYFTPFVMANLEPSMWDATSRVRYPFLADKRSVEAFAGSLAPGVHLVEGKEVQGLFFRTSDNKPLAQHDVAIARHRKGIIVRRGNVTIKDISFRNFQLSSGAVGVSVEAANTTVERCDFWNCWGGVIIGEKTPDATVRSCTGRDLVTGVKSYGTNTVVENCRFFRVDDGFAVIDDSQDQCGLQFYSSVTQTARGNLCVGFWAGVFIKASNGVAIVENNTVIAPPTGGDRGVGANTWRDGSICSGNVIVGYREPISTGTLAGKKDLKMTDNVMWLPSHPKAVQETMARIKTETGGQNVMAAPNFVDAAGGDYRLAPGGASAAAMFSGKPVGALGVAPAGTLAKPEAVAAVPAARQATGPAKIVGKPVVYSNDHGLVVIFKTDQACLSALEWGTGGKMDQKTQDIQNWPNESLVVDAEADEVTKIKRASSPHTTHCIALLGKPVAGKQVDYQIVLDSGKGFQEPVHKGQVTAKGAARVLHVSLDGADKEDGGEQGKPFATIQFAVDRALPGDKVQIAPGLYFESVWVKHGGVEGQPLVISPGPGWGVVLDGKKELETAFEIGRISRLPETGGFGCIGPAVVTHVQISGMEIRWYAGPAIRANESKDITIQACTIWSRHFVRGRPGVAEGICVYHCENVTIDHCLLFALNSAVRFNYGAGLKLTSNTMVKCFHRGIGFVNATGIYMRNNSFAFAGSYLIQLHGVRPSDVDSDYNNFGVYLTAESLGKPGVSASDVLKRESEDFYYGESKGVAGWTERTPEKPEPLLCTLKAWREACGQDKHSICAHPKFADPKNRDFGLLPMSPNVGAGEKGVNIGAMGVVKK